MRWACVTLEIVSTEVPLLIVPLLLVLVLPTFVLIDSPFTIKANEWFLCTLGLLDDSDTVPTQNRFFLAFIYLDNTFTIPAFHWFLIALGSLKYHLAIPAKIVWLGWALGLVENVLAIPAHDIGDWLEFLSRKKWW